MSWTVLTDSAMSITARDDSMDSTARIEDFLRDVQARAYRITLVTIRDGDDALDIVQEAMIRLVRRYSARPAAEWRPLFYRILKNLTNDWHRRQAVRRRVFGFFGGANETDDDPIERAPGPQANDPVNELERDGAMAALESAIGELPPRQRQAFMLRNFEGLDVAQTARAMGCSQGSVKTHYSRAVHRLRDELGEHWQ